MKLLAEKIKKEKRSLEQRGLPSHSFFDCHFKDESKRTEHDTNWSEISEEKIVKFGDSFKIVKICNLPLKKLKVSHREKSFEIELKEGEEVYQAVKSQTFFLSNGKNKTRIMGRIIGRVKDDKVIEEIFINDLDGEIIGIKYG